MRRAIAGAILGFVLLGMPLAGFATGGPSSTETLRMKILTSLVAVAAAANLGALIGGTGAIVAAIDRSRTPQSPTGKPED
jgi:hypothetical protein